MTRNLTPFDVNYYYCMNIYTQTVSSIITHSVRVAVASFASYLKLVFVINIPHLTTVILQSHLIFLLVNISIIVSEPTATGRRCCNEPTEPLKFPYDKMSAKSTTTKSALGAAKQQSS